MSATAVHSSSEEVLMLSSALYSLTVPCEPSLSLHEKGAARAELAKWAEGEIVKYKAADGKLLRARNYKTASVARAIIVALHGMQTHSKWFAPLASNLLRHGVDVVAIDRRGSGLNADIGITGQLDSRGTFDTWLRDITSAVESVFHAGTPIYLLGNSWGGNPVTAWAVSDLPKQHVRGLVLLTPGLSARKPNLLQKLEIALSPDSRLLGTCLSVKDYSDNRSTWALLQADEHMTRSVSARFFKQSNAMRNQAIRRLGRLRKPVLLLLAGNDRLMKNFEMESTLRASIQSGLLETQTLPNRYHLVLVEDSSTVAKAVTGWIERHP